MIATNIKEFFPPVLRLLFTLFREKRDGDRIPLQPGRSRLRAPAAVNRGRKPAAAPPRRRTIRGAADERRHDRHAEGGARLARGVCDRRAADQSLERVGAQRGQRRHFLPLPLFHVYGNVGVQALTFMIGAAMAIVPNPRDLADLLATVKRVKPTFFNGVPTLYIAMLNHPLVSAGKIDFKSIRICFSGAAPLLAETKSRFESLTGARIVEGYSLTEAMMALCVNPVQGPNKLGSVGMPLPDVTVRIFDDDEGRASCR